MRTLYILFLIILCLGCESSSKKQIEELRYNVNETFNKLNELGIDPSIKNSPFHLFSENANKLSERIISELNSTNPSKSKIKYNLDFLRNDLITHSIDDSLKVLYGKLLEIKEIEMTRKTKNKLKINILKAQHLFINEMFNAAIRVQTNEEPLPYIIPIKKELRKNEAMEAFLILPDPANTRLVFVAPKSLKYDSHRKNFIYIKGEPTSDKDSIFIEAIIENGESQGKHILIKEYFHTMPR